MTMLRFHCRSSFLDSLRVTPLSSSRSRRIVSILAICQSQQTIESLETAARWTISSWQGLSSCRPLSRIRKEDDSDVATSVDYCVASSLSWSESIHKPRTCIKGIRVPPLRNILSKVNTLNRCKLPSHAVCWSYLVHPYIPTMGGP